MKDDQCMILPRGDSFTIFPDSLIDFEDDAYIDIRFRTSGQVRKTSQSYDFRITDG